MTTTSADLACVIRQIETAIAFEVADKAIPSISYALIDRDGILASGHVQRFDKATSLNNASHFRIGSLTKMFTAIAIMQLVEKGRIDLDADVRRYLPEFAPTNPFALNGAPVTPRLLLSHTSGLVREAATGHYLDNSGAPLAATIAGLSRSTLKEEPGAGVYRYSNAGFAVLGGLVETVSGMDYADYVAANILTPLGMDDTALALTPKIRQSLAPASMWTFEGDSAAPVFDLGSAPAGNIFSTLDDVARFAAALLRGGFSSDGTSIVSPASLRQMWTPARRMDDKGYGLGFAVDSLDGWLSAGHGGVVYGYASSLSLLPMAGLGMVLFSTLDFTNQVLSRLSAYGLRLALAMRAMGKAPAPPRQLAPPDASQIADYSGCYRDTDGNEIEIRTKAGRLFLVEDDVPLEIKPLAPDSFVLDGRIQGERVDGSFALLGTPRDGVLTWQGRAWQRVEGKADEAVPPDVARHLGRYGPDFNPTELSYRRGELVCLIEFFCPHTCEPLADGRFRLHGALYEHEILELGATDSSGRTGIRVGEMFLSQAKQ